MVAQAQRAARSGVDLDTVLLHCAAGHRLLVGYVITEADGLPSGVLGPVLDLQAVFVERLMAEISIEHKRELGAREALARATPRGARAQVARR